MISDYEELLLRGGALTHILTPPFPLHSSTSFRVDIIKIS